MSETQTNIHFTMLTQEQKTFLLHACVLTSETDELEASSGNFDGEFAQGMQVVQDGYKRLSDGTQNFKYIP
ncbi:MAG: hypothetical protein HYR68_14480 [Burkholderiales bacterium]|nr:hypothetical protein [Burkholderiales bacterium]MBI3731171.1 hypothetical protein [Burkholderiales bacterium]